MQTYSTKKKDNGIRPVGVSERLQLIIGKTITGLLRKTPSMQWEHCRHVQDWNQAQKQQYML